MPEEAIRKRGGAKRWRTMAFDHQYAHVAVVRHAGKHGGHTILGPMHTRKKR